MASVVEMNMHQNTMTSSGSEVTPVRFLRTLWGAEPLLTGTPVAFDRRERPRERLAVRDDDERTKAYTATVRTISASPKRTSSRRSCAPMPPNGCG